MINSNTLPLKQSLKLAYLLSSTVAILMAAVSAAGLAFGSTGLFYGATPTLALGVTEAEVGLLVPGLLGQDAFNLIIALPLLLGAMLLARRGSLVGLLLWPGMLFYVLYWYVIYLVGAPFSVLFLLYAPLVTLSAYTVIALVASIDGGRVHRRLAEVVPARLVGGILVVLALLTLAQDTSGAFFTALSNHAPVDPAVRHVWISDLALVVPAVLVGGVLLWRRKALGYVAGAGLLLQYGLTPLGLVANTALGAMLVGSPLDLATSIVLVVFGVVCFVPLALFVRGAARPPRGARPGVERADARSERRAARGAEDETLEPESPVKQGVTGGRES